MHCAEYWNLTRHNKPQLVIYLIGALNTSVSQMKWITNTENLNDIKVAVDDVIDHYCMYPVL